jgi:CHASE3 domain sensor protein
MSKIWAMFCGIIFILGILYLMFYPVFFAIEHNATECIFAEDTMTCAQIKNK